MAYNGGSGTSEAPYQIDTAAHWTELVAISGDWDKEFIVTNNIDFGGVEIGSIDVFEGIFDGDGYTFTDAIIDTTPDASNRTALFRRIVSTGIIRNLTITDFVATGTSPNVTQSYCGIIAGEAVYGSLVTNCHVINPTVTLINTQAAGTGRGSIGGIIGANHGTITNCSVVEGSVKGDITAGTKLSIGGVVGFQTTGENAGEVGCIVNCTSSTLVGSINGNSSSSVHVGGITGSVVYTGGSSTAAELDNCTFTGTIDFTSDTELIAGGLSGAVSGTVINSINQGTVIITITEAVQGSDIGGICGEAASTCTITGNTVNGNITVDGVKGNRVGGLCGLLWGEITDCSFSGDITTEATGTGDIIGGICGYVRTGATIDSCFSLVDLSITFNSIYCGGGFGQVDTATISNCYARGAIFDGSAGSTVLTFDIWGGFIGYLNGSTIESCYTAIGPWSGTSGNREGFVGLYTPGTITDCYCDSDIAGHSTGLDGGEWKTTTELQTKSSYTGFDFSEGGNWKIRGVGEFYPLLSWEDWPNISRYEDQLVESNFFATVGDYNTNNETPNNASLLPYTIITSDNILRTTNNMFDHIMINGMPISVSACFFESSIEKFRSGLGTEQPINYFYAIDIIRTLNVPHQTLSDAERTIGFVNAKLFTNRWQAINYLNTVEFETTANPKNLITLFGTTMATGEYGELIFNQTSFTIDDVEEFKEVAFGNNLVSVGRIGNNYYLITTTE